MKSPESSVAATIEPPSTISTRNWSRERGAGTFDVVSLAVEFGTVAGALKAVVGRLPLVQAAEVCADHVECARPLVGIDEPELAGRVAFRVDADLRQCGGGAENELAAELAFAEARVHELVGGEAAFKCQKGQGAAPGVGKEFAAVYAFLAGFKCFEHGGATDRRYPLCGRSGGAAIALNGCGRLRFNCSRSLFHWGLFSGRNLCGGDRRCFGDGCRFRGWLGRCFDCWDGRLRLWSGRFGRRRCLRGFARASVARRRKVAYIDAEPFGGRLTGAFNSVEPCLTPFGHNVWSPWKCGNPSPTSRRFLIPPVGSTIRKSSPAGLQCIVR